MFVKIKDDDDNYSIIINLDKCHKISVQRNVIRAFLAIGSDECNVDIAKYPNKDIAQANFESLIQSIEENKIMWPSNPEL